MVLVVALLECCARAMSKELPLSISVESTGVAVKIELFTTSSFGELKSKLTSHCPLERMGLYFNGYRVDELNVLADAHLSPGSHIVLKEFGDDGRPPKAPKTSQMAKS